MRPILSSIPGIRVFLQNPPTISIGGRLAAGQYQFTMQSPDTDELYKYAVLMEEKIRDLPGFQDVTSDLQIKNPKLNVNIQRDKASAYGVTASQIEDALSSAYGSSQISTILAPNNQYYVITELEPEYQSEPSALSMLYIRSASSRLVPLSAVANITTDVGPLSINHQGQLPAVTLSFNLKPGTALGDAVDSINKITRETLPPTINTSFQGTAAAFQSSLHGLGLLLILAILVIYLVLGVFMKVSYIQSPYFQLFRLPALAHCLHWSFLEPSLSIYAFVGIIMLVGLVKKNGIMMIDFAIEAQRTEGKNPHDAILAGMPYTIPPYYDDDNGGIDGWFAHRDGLWRWC